MSEEIITKRLHVSGLTPAIRPQDLSQKLGSFGMIKALDGFDGVDGLGQPRQFGYVTIETTRTKLARCMNLLSGVTWKGTKLRIGEAKPDFRERLAQERAKMQQEAEGPPRKKRHLPKGVQGVHAPEMSLVTLENVHSRPGWRVTSSGRIIKPVRMRPDHSLLEPLQPTSSTLQKGKGKVKLRKKVKLPPTRARRRTIDPTKWGSVHLKGAFLQNLTIATDAHSTAPVHVPTEHNRLDEAGAESDEDDMEEEQALASDMSVPVPILERSTDVQEVSALARTQSLSSLPSTKMQKPDTDTDLLQEKNASLGLLQSLFGERDDWGGEESLDSDMEVDTPQRTVAVTSSENATSDFEEVPMDHQNPTDDAPPDAAVTAGTNHPTPLSASLEKPAEKSTKLKDLFAPKADAGGFSLLGHLDLDLELDDEVLDASFAPIEEAPVLSSEIAMPATTIQSTHTRTRFTFDPSLPLFFPLSEEERAGFRGRVKDLFDVALENGWNWRDFRRTETSEEIRQRWEEQKGELTKDWKRRHREALKARRRRGGGDGE